MPSSAMASSSLRLYLLTTLAASSALAQSTTVPAFFAPPRVAASVITVNPTATTYSYQCTSLCTGTEAAAGTMVNGPSTAGLTQIWTESDKTQKTLIYDCGVESQSVGRCVVHAVSDGKSGGSFTETSTFRSGAVLVTGGLEQLGYVLATATTEVEHTVTVKKTSGVATVTAGVVSNSTISGSTKSSPDTASITSTSANLLQTSSSASRTSPRSSQTAAAQTSVSVGAAAATLAAERIGGAVLGLAGLVLAAL